MPYIKKSELGKLVDRNFIDDILARFPVADMTKGDINYAITKLVHNWVIAHAKGKLNYTNRSKGHAVLQDATSEYYAAVMVRYEAGKRELNGPVSELDA